MVFSSEAIAEAHSQFTGVDFPKLIDVFKQMGMVINVYNIQSGQVMYEHFSGDCIEEQGYRVDVPIAGQSSSEKALVSLKRHQAGDSDFQRFCVEMAEAGVYKWISDLKMMTCSYYDLEDCIVVVEEIPKV